MPWECYSLFNLRCILKVNCLKQFKEKLCRRMYSFYYLNQTTLGWPNSNLNVQWWLEPMRQVLLFKQNWADLFWRFKSGVTQTCGRGIGVCYFAVTNTPQYGRNPVASLSTCKQLFVAVITLPRYWIASLQRSTHYWSQPHSSSQLKPLDI